MSLVTTEITTESLRILNDLPIAVVIIKNKEILYHNAPFIHLFSSRTTHIGEDITKFQHKEYQAVQSELGTKREEGENTISEYQTIGKTIDGENIPLFVKAQSVYYHQEYCSMAFLMRAYPNSDNEDLNRLRLRSMRKSQEFTFLQNLIKGLSHHINNKLAVASGQIGMLSNFEDEIDKDQVLGSLSSIIIGISEIIRNIRLFSGEKPNDFDRISLSNYVDRTLGRISSSFRFKYDIVVEEDSLVLLDQYYFLIILKLLLRFLSTHGQEDVVHTTIRSFDNHPQSVLLIAHELNENNAMMIEFSSLIDFSPNEIIEYMFPFHEADALFEGTALGAAAGIIKSMGFGLEYVSDDQNIILRVVIPKFLE